MKRWSLGMILAVLALLGPGTAFADDDWDEVDRFAFGIGLGLVDLSDSIAEDSTETYLAANFRILLGEKDKHEKKDDKTVVAYLEPEIGYWERDVRIPLNTVGGGTVNSSSSDFMVGLNIVGVVPFRKVDYFFGAGLAIHFFDVGLNADNVDLGSDETFGVNVQVGIDVHITDSFGVFGLLRLDLIEEVEGAQIGEEQAKIVLGGRFFFG